MCKPDMLGFKKLSPRVRREAASFGQQVVLAPSVRAESRPSQSAARGPGPTSLYLPRIRPALIPLGNRHLTRLRGDRTDIAARGHRAPATGSRKPSDVAVWINNAGRLLTVGPSSTDREARPRLAVDLRGPSGLLAAVELLRAQGGGGSSYCLGHITGQKGENPGSTRAKIDCQLRTSSPRVAPDIR